VENAKANSPDRPPLALARTHRYAVLCQRHDGTEREFATYGTLAEARRVRDHLASVGCLARIATLEGSARGA
jgi:hypothetical protein